MSKPRRLYIVEERDAISKKWARVSAAYGTRGEGRYRLRARREYLANLGSTSLGWRGAYRNACALTRLAVYEFKRPA